MINYTLKQLKYFVVVAESGNVTEASEKLYISQPAISNAISQLEETLNTQLLIRHHAKGVSLTPAGKEMLSYSRTLLSHAEEINGYMTQHSTLISGVINVGCYASLGPIYAPKLIQGFTKLYPEVSFKLFEGDIEEINEALLTGKIEMALMYDLNNNAQIESTELAKISPHVLLSVKHPLANRKQINLMTLKDEPLVLLDLPHSNKYFQSLFEQYDKDPIIKHRTKSIEMLRSLVANGEGYALMNSHIKSNSCFDGSELISIPLSDYATPISLVISKASGIKLPKRCETFLEFCITNFDIDNSK
ncbi:LysR family transcriptional regulator [Vibrio sp. RC27]